MRVVRAVGRCLTALADDLEQITAPDTGRPAEFLAADPQDTCKVGDPLALPRDGTLCRVGEHAPLGTPPQHRCQRRYNHTGQHVATAGNQVVAVWT